MVASVIQTTARAPAVRPSASRNRPDGAISVNEKGWPLSRNSRRRIRSVVSSPAPSRASRSASPSMRRTAGLADTASSVNRSRPASATGDPCSSGGLISSSSASSASPCQTRITPGCAPRTDFSSAIVASDSLARSRYFRAAPRAPSDVRIAHRIKASPSASDPTAIISGTCSAVMAKAPSTPEGNHPVNQCPCCVKSGLT